MAKSKGGRPSKFTKALADKICERLADGESMRTVCRDAAMPNMRTVFRWLRTNDEFRQQYARAKQESADAFAEDILEIADDGTNDWMATRYDEDGEPLGWQINGEHVQRSKLRIEARKWLASKMKPKKYGERPDDTTPSSDQIIEIIRAAKE